MSSSRILDNDWDKRSDGKWFGIFGVFEDLEEWDHFNNRKAIKKTLQELRKIALRVGRLSRC